MPSTDWAIAVDAICYRYPEGQQALHEVNLRIGMGESVGLIGPNGAGKTTLFLCLCGVLQADSGTVNVMGIDPKQPGSRRLLPRKVGITFQDSDDQLFNPTVLDEIAFGPLNLGLTESEVRSRVDHAMARVGLAGLEHRVPYHLSGGEKKRVALASILAMEPDVLLLDEPSSFLDLRGRRELIKLVNDLPMAKLIAAHDLEFIVATCSRVLLLDGGMVMADGMVREVLTNRALLEEHGMEVPHSLTHPHSHVR